jgi:hypothetical protein
MTPALKQAIEAVYEQFAAPTPARIEGCPCCIDRKTANALHDRPLRSLTTDDLGAYSSSVFLTVGDIVDFRYFLPRILELTVVDPSFYPGPEIVLGKLPLAGWKSWSKDDQTVNCRLVDVWFDEVAGTTDGDWDGFDNTLDSLLCGIGRAGLIPSSYFDRLLSNNQIFAVTILWEQNHEKLVRRGRLSNAFWDDTVEHDGLVNRMMAADVQAIVG